ncbi:MAG: hypothetical protein AAGG72_00295 [Pseudomonadota bacterium]
MKLGNVQWPTALALSLICACSAFGLSATGVSALGGYKGEDGLDRGYVIAKSRFGNGSIAGRVRPTNLGPQVQLPSGHWEYCRRSCSETLRVETVDFDERFGPANFGLTQECGIFGCLDLHFGR